MAGRKNPVTPGRRRLREELDATLAAARKLDRIADGAGDALAEVTATAVYAARMQAIRNRKSEMTSAPI